MKQVAIFTSNNEYIDLNNFETSVNRWIEDENIDVVDIKFSESITNEDHCISVLVIYNKIKESP